MYPIAIVLFMALFLQSCSSVKPAMRPERAVTDIDPRIRDISKGSGAITLLDHQLQPIDYMHKHPEIKGILVNHYMGTGKTYLGIGFAQSLPEHPVIILAPRFLESHWMNQLTAYGVNDLKRFTFVSYEDAPAKLSTLDVSNHIILADEVHNLIKNMRTTDADANAQYTNVYMNLRKAYKILGLTGTPLYGDESDIAFILNFVSGENLMPFNKEAFRLQYTKILPTRQFFRGYLTESNLLIPTLPLTCGMFFFGLMGGPIGLAIGYPLGIFAPVAVNFLADLGSFKLRELNVDNMYPVTNKYVSYFRFNDSHFKDFPTQDFQVREVPYNTQQYSFFLRLVEGDLPAEQLQRLLKNDRIIRDDDFIRINSTSIHEQFYSSVGAGRDIGNFEFYDESKKIIESPKFLDIYKELEKNNEQTVIYSNYYQTGILAFKEFLARQNYREKTAIIDPSMSAEQVNEVVAGYNRGDIRLLMLHPDVTEGISLVGTQFVHILEPMLNNTVLEQVIGRTMRYQSHSHLPKEKQVVHVCMWQSTSSYFNPDINNLKRANWEKRYKEISYVSRWGIGLAQVDKKYDRKAFNPEELSLLKLRSLAANLGAMQKLLMTNSIESGYTSIKGH